MKSKLLTIQSGSPLPPSQLLQCVAPALWLLRSLHQSFMLETGWDYYERLAYSDTWSDLPKATHFTSIRGRISNSLPVVTVSPHEVAICQWAELSGMEFLLLFSSVKQFPQRHPSSCGPAVLKWMSTVISIWEYPEPPFRSLENVVKLNSVAMSHILLRGIFCLFPS